jgi:transposase
LLKAVLSLPEPGGRPIDHRRDLRVVAHVASEGDRFAAVRQRYPGVRHIYIEAEAFISPSRQTADRELVPATSVNEVSRL